MTVIHTGPPPAEPAGGDVILSAGGWLFEPKGELWERDDRQVFTWQGVCGQGPVAIYRNETDLPSEDVLELARAIVADPHHADHILELREDGWTLKHPIAERIGNDLFKCPLAARAYLMREEWENDANEDLGLYKVELEDVDGDPWLRMELLEHAGGDS